MTLTATQKADRLALIAKIAERKKRLLKLKNASNEQVRIVNTPKPARKRKEIEIPKETNIYQWTDASAYAKEYYGETLHYTTKFDNDWN